MPPQHIVTRPGPRALPLTLLFLLLYKCLQVDLYSNFNQSRASQLQTSAAEPVSLPAAVLSPRTFARDRLPMYDVYNITRYEYKDTKYNV